MDKPTLRRELRALSREHLTDELRLTGSASIISQLRQHPLWQQAQHVALYAALPDEPNLRTLIDEVATTKQVYLPRVLDGETMEFFAFAGWQELEQSGNFGIYEPRLEANGAVDPATLDLLVIPALAYDQAGYRLGRGKGYYDRYLSRCPHASRIGVTFALRPIACLPHDPWDLPVEAVLTPQPALLSPPPLCPSLQHRRPSPSRASSLPSSAPSSWVSSMSPPTPSSLVVG